MYLEKVKNFGAVDELQVIGAVSNNCHAELVSASDQYGVNANFQTKKTLKQVQGDSEWDAKGNEKSEINGKKHPNIFNSQLSIFNSKKRYGFTLDEDTEIVSEDVSLSPLAGSKIASADVNLSPLRGKYPPEAGERGLKRGLKMGCQGLKRGFTLAEVLITLVVIGVVAAITIPVLHSNTGGKEFNAAKQKARAGLAEAFKLISVQNELPDITADEFARTVLPRYIKLAKNCTSAVECGFPDKVKTPDGNSVNINDVLGSGKTWEDMIGVKAHVSDGVSSSEENGEVMRALTPAFFQTVDGFSVSVFYNPYCHTDNEYEPALGAACFSAVYDMNGKKGPNRVGDDIGFAGSFYTGIKARSAAVLPVGAGSGTAGKTIADALAFCSKINSDYNLPTLDELSLIFLNNSLVGNADNNSYWSRTYNPDPAGQSHRCLRVVGFQDGIRGGGCAASLPVRCTRADKLM